jgi:energy-coupling factor transport system permease protein
VIDKWVTSGPATGRGGWVYRLDPRARLLLTVLVGSGAMFLFNQAVLWALYVVVFVHLLSARMFKPVIGFVLLLVLHSTLLPVARDMSGNPLMMLVFMLFFLIRMGPIVLMMLFMAETVNVSALIRSLEKMRLPREIIIPLAVTIRFLPSMAQEFGFIKDAMRFRGLSFSYGAFLRRPVKTVEYILVPLLMRSLKIGDELAASASTRAIESPYQKTFFRDVRLRVYDWAYMALLVVSTAVMLVLDKTL